MKATAQESNSIEAKKLSQKKTTSSDLAFPLPSSAPILLSLSATYKLPASSPLPGETVVRGSVTHKVSKRATCIYLSPPSFPLGEDLPFKQGQGQCVASWV